jgi:hypothetical protein
VFGQKHVTVWKVDALEDWRDYFLMLTKTYNILSKCGVQIIVNHIFTALSDANDNLPMFFTRVSELPEHQRVFGDVISKEFVPQRVNRLEALRCLQIETVLYKGLPGYKEVLMHEKCLPFVPRQHHSDDLYKKPSEEVLQSEKEDQGQRKKYKKMKKNLNNASV